MALKELQVKIIHLCNNLPFVDRNAHFISSKLKRPVSFVREQLKMLESMRFLKHLKVDNGSYVYLVENDVVSKLFSLEYDDERTRSSV